MVWPSKSSTPGRSSTSTWGWANFCGCGSWKKKSRLKRLVADHSLDKHILSEALRKKSKAGAERSTSGVESASQGVVRGLVAWPSSVEPRGIGRAARRINPSADARSGPCPTPVRLCANVVLFRREGWLVNRKCVRRLYWLDGSRVRLRWRNIAIYGCRA